MDLTTLGELRGKATKVQQKKTYKKDPRRRISEIISPGYLENNINAILHTKLNQMTAHLKVVMTSELAVFEAKSKKNLTRASTM